MALQFIKFLKEAPAPRLSRPHSTKPHNTGKPSSLRKMTFSEDIADRDADKPCFVTICWHEREATYLVYLSVNPDYIASAPQQLPMLSHFNIFDPRSFVGLTEKDLDKYGTSSFSISARQAIQKKLFDVDSKEKVAIILQEFSNYKKKCLV